jgi:hypothetical protein
MRNYESPDSKSKRVDKMAADLNAADKPEGKLRGINISMATNGFSVTVDREPPEEKKGKGSDSCCTPWTPPPTTVFTGKKELLAYLSQHLG